MNKRKGNKRYERARRRRQRLLFVTVIGLLLCEMCIRDRGDIGAATEQESIT